MNKSAPTQIVHRKPRGMHYTPHQATMNAFACAVCGIKAITEQDWIDADVQANLYKAAKAELHAEKLAMRDQINWLDKTGQL